MLVSLRDFINRREGHEYTPVDDRRAILFHKHILQDLHIECFLQLICDDGQSFLGTQIIRTISVCFIGVAI